MRYRYPILLLAVLSLLMVACGSNDAPVRGSDLAVLAQQAQGYAQAGPGQPLVFPRDHGPHPDYRIEWWYLTANLSDEAGRPYGAQWTLFRLAVRPPGTLADENAWQSDQMYMAHFAITTPDTHVSFQRYSRGGQHEGESRAGVSGLPFSAWLDDWHLQSTGTDWLPLSVKARQDDDAMLLELSGKSPLVLQGNGGFSQKHPDGGGSFYYSQPFLHASGELTVDGQTIPVTGEAWLDREWSSQFLQGSQVGWDWFSLHLNNGEKLMLFRLRQSPGEDRSEEFIQAKLISNDDHATSLDPAQITMESMEDTTVAGRQLPLRWRIELPQIARNLDIKALHPDQWMDVDFPYWEGVVTVSGSGPENSGRGYMELTGYTSLPTTQP